MFGEVMSLRRPSASAPSDANVHPTFTLYLLPSLRIPFRRYRIYEPPASPSSAATASRSEPSSPLSSSSNSTTPSLSSSSSSPSSPLTPISPLPPLATGTRRLSRAHPPTLRCSTCSTDLAFVSQIISKGFHGRHGRAYLVSPPPPPSPSSSSPPLSPQPPSSQPRDKMGGEGNLVNIRVGPPEDRHLVTGDHVVADIHCVGCGAVVGWKYIDAKELEQRYKVGMFILETKRVAGFHAWEDLDVPLAEEEEMDGGEEQDGQYEKGESLTGVEYGEEGDGVVVFDSEDEDECEDLFAGVWDARVVARRRSSRRSEEF